MTTAATTYVPGLTTGPLRATVTLYLTPDGEVYRAQIVDDGGVEFPFATVHRPTMEEAVTAARVASARFHRDHPDGGTFAEAVWAAPLEVLPPSTCVCRQCRASEFRVRLDRAGFCDACAGTRAAGG